MISAVEDLIQALGRLPGFGRRSAGRAALRLLTERERLLEPLLLALETARRDVVRCARCGAFTERTAAACPICADPSRANGILCVVEDPADIVSLEASGAFRGRYHVLGGKLSPARRIGPERLRIPELLARVPEEGITEVLFAVSTDMEGDATAGYVADLLTPLGVKSTRLAFGLPADSGVAYSDPLTLRRAINARLSV